jgi:hypothetical protein
MFFSKKWDYWILQRSFSNQILSLQLQNSLNFWKFLMRIMWRSQIKLLHNWIILRISSLNFREILQRYFFVRTMSRLQKMSSSKKGQTIIFWNCIMIRLIDAQLNKSRWRRLASRQNYWLWVESRRRQSDEDDFSSQFNTIRWKSCIYAVTIVRFFVCWKKKY